MRISFALLLFTLISYLALGQKDTAGNQEDLDKKTDNDPGLSMKLEDFFKRFEFMPGDSASSRKHMERFPKKIPFELFEFDFDGLDFGHIPMDNDKLEELNKSIEDFFNNKFEERIQEFIEKHKNQLDEIRYEIYESIPRHGKAI